MGRITETLLAAALITMATVNVSGETNIPLTLTHEHRKATLS